MQLPKRNTVRIIETPKISSPQKRSLEGHKDKVPVLCYVDEGGGLDFVFVTNALHKKSSGENLIGRRAEGFDRLLNMLFRIHLDENDVAFGIDVLSIRRYGQNVIPSNKIGIENVEIKWEPSVFMTEVVNSPYNFRHTNIVPLLDALDRKALSSSPQLQTGELLLGGKVRVESVGSNVAEFKFLEAGGGAPAFES